jgi:hypothetical protein
MMATFPNPEKQKRAPTAKRGALCTSSATTTEIYDDAIV